MAPRRSGRGHTQQHQSNIAHTNAQEDAQHPSSSSSSSKFEFTVDTSQGDTTASLMRATMDLAEKVLVIEERTTFLGELLKIRRGTREVEGFIKKQENLRHELKENVTREKEERMIEREREIVMKANENKLTDNILEGARKGRELHQLKGRLMWRLRREEERRERLDKPCKYSMKKR